MVCLDDPHSEIPCAAWFRLGFDIFITLSILILNSFIVFAVLQYWKRQTVLHSCKASSFLIINLCTADITVAVCFVYQFLPRYLCSMAEYLSHHFVPCVLRTVLISIALNASFFALVAIAVDRYVAVVHALRYREMMNTRRTLIMIGITWLLAVLCSTTVFYWNNWVDGQRCEEILFLPKYYEFVIVPICIMFVLGSMTTVYWKIHRVALSVHNRSTPQDLTPLQRINTRSARTLLMILIVYTVTWPPYLVVVYTKRSGYQIPIILFEVMSSVTKVHNLANPFIYAFNTRSVRSSMLRTLRSLRKRLSSRISNTSWSSTFSGRTEPIWTIPHTSRTDSENHVGPNEHYQGLTMLPTLFGNTKVQRKCY